MAKRKVVWSQGRRFSAAKVWIKPKSKIRASGGYVYPIGAIIQKVGSEGLEPHILLSSPRDVKVQDFSSSYANGERRYYNLTSAAPEYRLDFTWRVPQREYYLAVLFYALLPLLVIIATAAVIILPSPGVMRPLLRLLVFSFPVHWIAAYLLAHFSVFPNAQQFWFRGLQWKAVSAAAIYDVLSVLVGFGIGMLISCLVPVGYKTGEEEPVEFDPEDDYADEREPCD